MKELNAIIGVPQADTEALVALANRLEIEGEVSRDRYFGGADYVDMAVQILTTGAAWETLRLWIKTRAEVAKATRVVIDGIELTAVNPKQADGLLRAIEKHFPRDATNGQS